MQIERNRPLNIIDTLKASYSRLLQNVKEAIIISYVLAMIIFLSSLVLPSIPTEPSPNNYIIFLTYVCVGLIVHVVLSFFTYRLLALGKGNLLKISPAEFLSIMGKMFLYSVGLLFLLFLAMLALLLFVGLITAIINGVTEQAILSNSILEALVNITMLAISLLIIMRLQPTFISLALNENLVPMKSAFYYTRDNNKELSAIGLFGFIPSMMPMLIVFWLISITNLSFLSGDILALVLFPFLVLPNLVILSAGVEIYCSMVKGQIENKVDVSV